MLLKTLISPYCQLSYLILLFFLLFSTDCLYSSACDSQSSAKQRICQQGTNVTEYILSIKKGGTDVLSTDDYDSNFFHCEQYTYDCGYVQTQKETISIANGIQLNMPESEVDQILPSNSNLAQRIKPYLNISDKDATCGQRVFPLILNAGQSVQFFQGYSDRLVQIIQQKYDFEKQENSPIWSDINVNIKTAVVEVIKEDYTLLQGEFWAHFLAKNSTQMAQILQASYKQTNQLYLLHCAYLIKSVSQQCNKYQSVNFLLDQSKSVKTDNFDLALQFLQKYYTSTLDDPTISSINAYATNFQKYMGYGHNREEVLALVKAKVYGDQFGTKTGFAINQTIKLIQAQNFENGIPKILVILTDGSATDSVEEAADNARSKDITIISVGIGQKLNKSQLKIMAGTDSNVILVKQFDDLPKLVDFISNFFCKQIINIELNQTIVGNVVRTVDSPAYFRVAKDKNGALYQLNIDYQENPDQAQEQVCTSQYDPFPDVFSDFIITEVYRPSITQKVYFIQPLQTAPIRIKKDLYENRTVTNSYVSVGGTNLRFNISLVPCQTDLCIEERKQISQKSQKLQKDRREFGTKANDSPADGKDYNIYAIIIGSFIGLICSVIIGIGALKKICGQEDQMLEDLGERIQSEAKQQNISAIQQENTQSLSVSESKSRQYKSFKKVNNEENILNQQQ